jgi:hypothetical protein
MKFSPLHRILGAIALGAFVLLVPQARASSHREALAILNEPCADNTDTFAWVAPGTHDKLYLIMDFNPLHEPGQGNQGLRACDGYRYEFHIGIGTSLADKAVYRVEFNKSIKPAPAPGPNDAVGGGNELLWQLTGGTETMTVTRIMAPGNPNPTLLGDSLPVLPNNHGPQTDRLVYGLAPFKGYDSGDSSSRDTGLYDQAFVDKYIQNLNNGGRIIAGQFDDPYQLDEKGIFDLVNLGATDLGGIPGARHTEVKDVFTGFNIFSIALEVPMTDVFPNGIPHNGTLDPKSTDSLLRVWASISRQATQTVDTSNIITGLRGSGNYVQVGRNALPLFNAGLVGTQRQTLYLHTDPMKDVTRFGNDILFPVLVRDAEALGIYKALGVPDSAVKTLKGPRLDIVNAINLGRPIPVADGSTGDVITLDAATDSAFPNGRRLGGGPQPNMHNVNVNSVLISLIVAGDPKAGLARGVETNDKDFVPRFPFLAPAHQGLLQGHGGINAVSQPNIPNPNSPPLCQ